MKCNICKKNDAIIHIHEYSDMGVRKINLCLECALNKGLNTAVESLDNIFAELIQNIFNISYDNEKDKNLEIRDKVTLICPACHTTIDNFTEEMRIGCPACYTVFEKIIDLLIYKMNNSLIYKGKLPEFLNDIKIHKTKLNKLKTELKQHIGAEEFQKAAIIRDEIKELKKTIQKGIKKIASQ